MHHKPQLLETLSIKPFLWLWLSQLISQIAVNMLVFVSGVLAYESNRTNTSVSLLYLAVGIPAAFFGIFSGILVDRFNKRTVLITSTILRMLLILLLFFYQSSLILVLLLNGVISVINQFFLPAEAGLIPRFVPNRLLMSANSLFTVTFYGAIIGGFVFGGPMLAWMGSKNVILFLVLLCFIATVFLFFINYKTAATIKIASGTNHTLDDFIEGINFIRNSPLIFQAIALMTIAQMVISVFLTLGPGLADQILSLKLTDASLVIMAPAAIGMIIGAMVIGSIGQNYRKRNLINWGIWFSGLILLFVSGLIRSTKSARFLSAFEHIFFTSWNEGILPVAIICFFLLGVGNSLIDISCNTVLQEHTPDQLRGRIYGVLSSIISGVALLPVIISGILADKFGIGKIIFSLGLILFLFGMFVRKFHSDVIVDSVTESK